MNELMKLIVQSPEDIVAAGYATLPKCPVCGRAEAEADCETEFDIPVSLRLCRRRVDGEDITCSP
jgi:hypothetical protein